jgi:hypothetical protein
MRTVVYTALAASVCASIAGAQAVARKEPVHYAGGARASLVRARPPGMRLALGRAREFALGPLSAAERARLAQRSTPLAIGINRPLPADALDTGAWETAADGESVWRMAISSPGAAGIRVEFLNFSAGAGNVWLYAGEQVAGPYTGQGIYDNGHFWSATIFSDSVTLEYEPAPGAATGASPPFSIDAISQQATAAAPVSDAPVTGVVDTADYCELDPNCYPDWQPAMSMVAQIAFEQNGLRYLCSGSLVATRDDSFKPYLLTAGHCINTEDSARSLEVYWKYQTSSCNGPPPAARDANEPATLGGHLLASGSLEDGDYSLVLLTGVPNDVTFSGWDTGDPPQATPLVGIHHPEGSWKRISFGDRVADATEVVEGSVTPGNLYLQVQWGEGRIEPGSSGSPLFSSPGVVVGTLTYGPESPTLSACQIDPFVAGYGRFSNTYPYIMDYLEDLPATDVLPNLSGVSFTVANHQAPASQTIQLTTQSAAQAAFKLRADAPWILLSTPSGSLTAGKPAQFSLTVDPAQLMQPGQYSSTVTILSGAAPPQFINVSATASVDQSDVVASISPNPAYQSGGLWSFTVQLAETAGAGTTVTVLRVNGVDYSSNIAAWFGTSHLAANAVIKAALSATGLPLGDQYFEFEGTDDAGGQTWYRTATVTLR